MNISGRLKEERKRLGLNQADFAALGGVKKHTQLNYESGLRNPDTSYLLAIEIAGVDVWYVLTGKMSIESMTVEESELLASYRTLDARGKTGVRALIEGMALTSKQEFDEPGSESPEEINLVSYVGVESKRPSAEQSESRNVFPSHQPRIKSGVAGQPPIVHTKKVAGEKSPDHQPRIKSGVAGQPRVARHKKASGEN